MLHTTENAGEDLPLRRFHCNGENRLKPYDEFGSARFGGAEGNRTPVRKQLDWTFSGRSLLFTFPRRGGSRHSPRLSSFMMRDAGKAYCVHGRH